MKTETFDRDPGWDGRNNRPADPPRTRAIRQDFGYSRTAHAGGKAGEVGGFISPAAEPAYYAKEIAPRDASTTPLTASGHARRARTAARTLLLGFFNAGTLNEWRTPNTIALRLSGRGDDFYAWVEYCHLQAGGPAATARSGFPGARDPKTGRDVAASASRQRRGPPLVARATTPRATTAAARSRATIDDQTAVCNLVAGHKADGRHVQPLRPARRA